MTLIFSKKSLDYNMVEFMHIFTDNGYSVTIEKSSNPECYQLAIGESSDDDF